MLDKQQIIIVLLICMFATRPQQCQGFFLCYFQFCLLVFLIKILLLHTTQVFTFVILRILSHLLDVGKFDSLLFFLNLQAFLIYFPYLHSIKRKHPNLEIINLNRNREHNTLVSIGCTTEALVDRKSCVISHLCAK